MTTLLVRSLRQIVALAVLTVIAAACTSDGDGAPEPGPETPTTPASTATATTAPTAPSTGTDERALDAECTNDDVGATVAYPAGWEVNDGTVLPACSLFDPESVEVREGTEIPRDIAITLRVEAVSSDRVADVEADPTVEVRSREETTVGGREAVAAEVEHTGEGLYDAGDVTYAYYVDLDERTLIAQTHQLEAADPPGYDERREILDAMMAAITFGDAG